MYHHPPAAGRNLFMVIHHAQHNDNVVCLLTDDHLPLETTENESLS